MKISSSVARSLALLIALVLVSGLSWISRAGNVRAATTVQLTTHYLRPGGNGARYPLTAPDTAFTHKGVNGVVANLTVPCTTCTHARSAKTLVDNLRNRGFQVSHGYPMLYPIDACGKYTYPVLKNCSLNNPAGPYVEAVVKSWPKEYVDPAAVNAFGEIRPGYSATYRLDPREAIVIYGKMPPPGKYMGLQTWEFSQDGRWKAEDYYKWAHTPNRPVPMQYLFDTIPPNDRKSGRVISLSALGDIVNNTVMQRRSGYPFGQKRYFIISPSASTDRAVRRALRAQRVPGRDVFTEQIPSRDSYGPIGPLGLGKNAIDFVTAFRYAIPDPGFEKAAEQWRSRPPLTVLRVRAPSSLGPVRRYGALAFEKRTAHSEAYLAGDQQKLVNAVCDRASRTVHLHSTDCAQPPPASSLVPELFDGLGWTGPYCRETNMDCLADQQDAAYYVSRPLPLDSGQVYAAVGTLATATGNATYVGLGVNDASMLVGVSNTLDTDLQGSARSYAATVKHTGKFYVHYFSRHCEPLNDLPGAVKNCTEITPQMVPRRGDTTAPGDPALHGMFMASLRDYIVPGTERGPDSSKLLPPRIIAFTKP
jgi:hypothetical protein